MRNLKKHLEKIYRKVALKLVKQGAGPPLAASADAGKEENPVSQEAFHISGVHPSRGRCRHLYACIGQISF